MTYIIVKGSPFVKGGTGSDNWNRRKDELHRRRKELESELRPTMFNKDQMMMRDCKSSAEEEKRVQDYDRWKATKDKTGKTNEDKLREFCDINREFKKHGEEGRKHDADDLRVSRQIRYD